MEKFSLELVLDVGGRKQRLQELYMDSLVDSLDRFNCHGQYVEMPQKIEDDWNKEFYLIVKLKENNLEDVGFVCLSKYQLQRRATVTFYLNKHNRSQGILSECVPFLGNRIFRELGFNKVEASAWATNEVAVAIYDKWLKREGTIRERGYYGGQYVDQIYYGCLCRESDFQ